MQIELTALQPELIKTSAETDALMEKIEQDSVEAEAQKEVGVIYLENNARVVPYFERRPYTTIKIWYNPCIIRQYIHSKTDENHVLFSFLYNTASKCGILYDFCVIKQIFTRSF